MTPLQEAPESFVSIPEFCRRSTLGRTSVYEMIERGELPKPVRLVGNRVAFPERVWREWAASKVGDAA